MADLVVSAEHATYAISRPKVGRGAPWAAPLAWIVGPRMLELLTTAAPLPGPAHVRPRFVNRVVPYDELLPAAEARRAIAENAPLSVRCGKRMVYRYANPNFGADLDAADEMCGARLPQRGRPGGPQAFREAQAGLDRQVATEPT
ncbi:MAG: hypothetical protein R2736_23355 [Solirubrobacterales bacterium]